MHAAKVAGPGIGQLRGSPHCRPLCPRSGRSQPGEGRGHGLICITARRVRRQEAALVPGAGSDFESTAAAASGQAGSAAVAAEHRDRSRRGTQGRRYRTSLPGRARPSRGSSTLCGTLPRALLAAAAVRMLRGCSFAHAPPRAPARPPTLGHKRGAARRALHGST